MRYTKEVNCNEERVRFFSRVSAKTFICMIVAALLSVGAIVLLAFLTFDGEKPEPYRIAIFVCLCVVFSAVFLFCTVYCVVRLRCPHNAVIDDEHIILRCGTGYINFNRYEIGAVTTKTLTVRGRGDKDITVSRTGIKFVFGMKKRFVRVSDTDKIAYVLTNMAQNPDSGVDWGVAYESK